MALNNVKKVDAIDPETGKPVRGLYSQPCGTFTVTRGAMTTEVADIEYVADFQVGGERFRRALCRESGFASEARLNRKSGEWETPAFENALTMLKSYRAKAKENTGPVRRKEELAHTERERKAKDAAKRQQEAAETEQQRTVADLIKEYRPVIESKVKTKSFASIKGHLDRIEADLGATLLADLNLKRLESWQAAMKKLPRTSKVRAFKDDGKPKHKPKAPQDKLRPLSPLTVNRHIQTLKAMMTKARDWAWISDSHLTEIRKLELDEERDRRRLDFLSREEADRLVACADEVIRPIIICALQTGMRKEEILGLKWTQVDLAHRFIHLSKTKSGEPRSLPINDRLFLVLKQLPRGIKDDHVFLNPEPRAKKADHTAQEETLKPLHPTRWSDLKTPFNRAVKKAKLAYRGIVFHHLRHTAASWMVMAGVPLLTVARVLGHADVQMVSRYSHLTPDHMDKALASLAGEGSKEQEQQQEKKQSE